jgi:hypothetical protein
VSGIRGRRGWVLVLLAAVFSMHGLQCVAADSGAPAWAHGTGHSVAAVGPDDVLHLVGSDAAMVSVGNMSVSAGDMSAPPAAAVTAAMVGVPLGWSHDSSPHGSGHLWAWCLAILAAGLAALLLALIGSLPGIRLPRPRRVTGRAWAWLSPPRPPDLYSLCLMRI